MDKQLGLGNVERWRRACHVRRESMKAKAEKRDGAMLWNNQRRKKLSVRPRQRRPNNSYTKPMQYIHISHQAKSSFPKHRKHKQFEC